MEQWVVPLLLSPHHDLSKRINSRGMVTFISRKFLMHLDCINKHYILGLTLYTKDVEAK
jgi:hypothetical protein